MSSEDVDMLLLASNKFGIRSFLSSKNPKQEHCTLVNPSNPWSNYSLGIQVASKISPLCYTRSR